jgi:hypothetical protein
MLVVLLWLGCLTTSPLPRHPAPPSVACTALEEHLCLWLNHVLRPLLPYIFTRPCLLCVSLAFPTAHVVASSYSGPLKWPSSKSSGAAASLAPPQCHQLEQLPHLTGLHALLCAMVGLPRWGESRGTVKQGGSRRRRQCGEEREHRRWSSWGWNMGWAAHGCHFWFGGGKRSPTGLGEGRELPEIRELFMGHRCGLFWTQYSLF